MKKRATPATSTAESVYSGPGEITKLLADVEAFGKFVDELSVTILGVSRLDTVWKVGIFLQFVRVFVVFVCGKPTCLTLNLLAPVKFSPPFYQRRGDNSNEFLTLFF